MEGAHHSISGSCHCGNLSYELRTAIPKSGIRARACDCRFCRIHAALNWSDPDGRALIRISDEQRLQRYRFALRTADFFICTICGAYLGAVLFDEDGTWSTVNLRLSGLLTSEEPASYGAETEMDRVERRKRLWTPSEIVRR